MLGKPQLQTKTAYIVFVLPLARISLAACGVFEFRKQFSTANAEARDDGNEAGPKADNSEGMCDCVVHGQIVLPIR
jgi:hypothetical protein